MSNIIIVNYNRPMKKKKRLLLINPWIYDFACYDLWLKPLGFLMLARLLSSRGYDISFVDCLDIHHPGMKDLASGKGLKRREYGAGRFYKENIKKPEPLKELPRHYSRYGITPELFKKELSKRPAPDAILVTSMMTYWYPGPFMAIEMAKGAFPDVPVILGGIYAALCYEHAKKLSGADYVIKAGDINKIADFLDRLTGRKSNSEEKEAPDRYPMFDLLGKIDTVCLLTSRGCPYSCLYCASPLLSPGFTFKDPLLVADEIEYWHEKKGVKDFAFYDDALLYKPDEHLIPILKEILQRNIKCNLHAPNGLHFRGMTSSLASLMRKAGFRTIRWGLETSDVKRQLSSGGKITNEEFKEAVGHLKEAGFPAGDIGVYILAGLPFQKKEDVIKTIRFVKESGARPVITEYSPIPGTKLFDDAIRASKFPVRDEPLVHNNTIVPCQWEGLTYKDMDDLKLMTRPPLSMQGKA